MPSSKLPKQESIKITFRKTDPWEVLLRERLTGLPDNHRKLFFNALVRASGVRLTSQEQFNHDVEQFLITLPHFGTDHAGEAIKVQESMARQGATQVETEEDSTPDQAARGSEHQAKGFGALSI